jgi:hypothetical protein
LAVTCHLGARVSISKHTPAAPVANRSKKGPGDHHQVGSHTTHEKRPCDLNTSEQGDTADIKQNTTNKGVFRGQRVKEPGGRKPTLPAESEKGRQWPDLPIC